ncbi:ATP-binding protein [Fulvivirga ulvae]|uniref:sensor histidine kinase n=1 Tax=Fulvivirga ulvae TaxID=2904245 RepID=UPI001F303638|nr:HAMP domain-containing sensor histidine kinase [Fulvivirga ulvae]UII30257.1 ATP-binding protein [Fulvivirga ulvae]
MSKFKGVLKGIQDAKKDIFDLIERVEEAAQFADGKQILEIIDVYKEKVALNITTAEEQSKSLKTEYLETLDMKTQELQKEISLLKKTNDTVVSNNYLLEYKKKDLMLLADNLEEAYEEISQKNNELREQKKQISEQTEKLRIAHEQILRKNKELEMQKESIMDQAEYLHEANKTISQMHAEVEKQKDEILKKNKELINLNNEKNNLIGIVAHDLKSPLNQIKGFTTIIKLTANLDEDTLKYLESIEMSANRLNEMIGKILDIEAIESRKLNIKLEGTNLSDILKECVSRYKITAAEKSIEINEHIEDNIRINIDISFINQVFENLISNAIKFSPSDTEISVILTQKNDKVIFNITDQGPGISDEDQKKLFGKYQKLTARPTGNETSTGLGLSIVKQFVEAMGGSIRCQSNLGKGTSFIAEFKALVPEASRET